MGYELYFNCMDCCTYNTYITHHVDLAFAFPARDKADNKKLFGISFARLMEPEEATLQDGVHELFVYRCDERTKLHPAEYLGLAASVHESSTWTSSPEPGSVFSCSHKEIMTIRTMLCSTKLTQNGTYNHYNCIYE